ncbi:exonuclease subunit SbcD [Acerihabitans arboris]|uniref:Nuclease SbcCD subunit D n=1 Tax=Acerihabitans arboris TaxID=2691583 RepID=A0A845SPW4_9GAMM|nr:exonuclease subunit SbcD [Acerihabitans arboris]NDL64966.1 exonuclease subunit SbcD [Acerihabitans arboris]
MRIIHTSDWHLGQSFFTKNRAREHRAFLQWLVAQVEEHRIDAVIVAGDIFDTGTPPSYARELFNRFVVELQPTGCQLIALAGNHDAVATLNESRALLACMNTHVIAGTAGAGANNDRDDDENIARDDDDSGSEQPVFLLRDRSGNPGAILCAIPFLRPRDVLTSRAGQSGDDKQRALMDAIAAHYQALYDRALALRATLPGRLPIIATGHLTTVGAAATDSVRDIYIGSLDAFPAQLFPPADYVALGHIHRPQCIGGQQHIRYCGSPIALSFDETGQPKQVNMVNFDAQGAAEILALPIPETQALHLIKGNLAEIEAQLRAFGDYQAPTPVWLDIEVVTDAWLNDIQQHIQQVAANLPVEIVLLRRNREQRRSAPERLHRETLVELSVGDVFERRLALIPGPAPGDLDRLRLLYRQVAADIQRGAAAEDTLSPAPGTDGETQ